jgi:hypothetical protein
MLLPISVASRSDSTPQGFSSGCAGSAGFGTGSGLSSPESTVVAHPTHIAHATHRQRRDLTRPFGNSRRGSPAEQTTR